VGKLIFDDYGRFVGLKGREIKQEVKKELKTSDSLSFLKDDKFENAGGSKYWNFYIDNKPANPLKFSNKKTQEDIVKEIVGLIKNGKKIIFLHGACGTGKSAIALNVAKIVGKTSIVVPVKALQKQYEDDYEKGKKYVLKNSMKMKIAMITGRDNHDSIFMPGMASSDIYLPENIKITEKNYQKLLEYYEKNPFKRTDNIPDITDIKRMSIAPVNPYWSPILPKNFEANLTDAKKIMYRGCDGRDYVFYHRKRGCSYYDQYLAYTKADVIIFNSAKYKSELSLGRKPLTEIDIIDEGDEFLDSLFDQEEINLTRLSSSLKLISSDSEQAKKVIKRVIELIDLEEKNKRAVGVDENKIFEIAETQIREILELMTKSTELEAEIETDELNYSNKILEVSRNFQGDYQDIYLTYRKEDDNLMAKLVSSNLAAKFRDLMSKTKVLIFMSGTIHNENVLRKIFGLKDYEIVEAETINQGSLEIIKTGAEFDCRHANFASKKYSRGDYLNALLLCINKTENPTLVHVNAFQDLPNEDEKKKLKLNGLISSERLKEVQLGDKIGKSVELFKLKLSNMLFTTKCSRGVDFPGDICRSIIFTKYPNPNVMDTFWKVLQRTHPDYFWEFYKDKAFREFLQRIYRAVRSVDDHVYILSPDIRVLDEVRKLQMMKK
jgi:Rad3-related DNA helicase